MEGKTREEREAELRELLQTQGSAEILVTWMRVVPPPGMIILPPKNRSPIELIGQILDAEYPPQSEV
jgi:hypothetical protein